MMKNSSAFSPLWFPQKNTNLSLSRVVLLYYTLYKKRARGGVKLSFSRFYNRIELLSLFFSDRGEKDRERKERTLLLLKSVFVFVSAKTKQNDNVDKQQRKRHSEIGV